jgi:hypothetical protein
MKNCYHVLRQNDSLNMQKFFIFVDTETFYSSKTKENSIQKLKLGWCLFWNRPLNIKEYKYFEKIEEFWDFVEEKINICGEIIIYAHNTDFDMKVLDGYNELLIKRNWECVSPYITNQVYVLDVEKDKMKLHIWDTFNYFQTSLKNIGKMLNFPKMEIDFDTCSKEELSIYCKNDVEILFQLIKNLIDFLEKYDLSKLKPTKASLSFNCFKHKFYNKKDKPIYIHNTKFAIKLERNSYKGGICDCFKVGKFKDKLYHLDCNSMYPYVMKNFKLPTKLIYYHFSYTENLYEKMINALKNEKLVIIGCNIYLPEKYAYILNKVKFNDTQVKSIFLSGNYNIVLTTPEINFVLKYGKINKVYEIAIYDSDYIFNDFVDFFYNMRIKFKEENNDIYQQFCKYIMNSLYGKLGQRKIKYKIEKTRDNKIEISNSIETINSDIPKRTKIMQLGNKLFTIESNEENAFDSFVAIASHVTSYGRMILINLILKAERNNTYYVDTDCLIVNNKGYENLKEEIDNKQLGKLKIENESVDSEFLKPKMYKFNDKNKCKGIKRNAIILNENEKEITFKQEQFEKFKTALNKKHLHEQHFKFIEKTVNKIYDKGKLINNIVYPFKLNNYWCKI